MLSRIVAATICRLYSSLYYVIVLYVYEEQTIATTLVLTTYLIIIAYFLLVAIIATRLKDIKAALRDKEKDDQ